jgi:hypothetical protein
LLDDEILPTNSDAVLVLAKFQAVMAHFYNKYYRHDKSIYSKRWFTNKKSVDNRLDFPQAQTKGLAHH